MTAILQSRWAIAAVAVATVLVLPAVAATGQESVEGRQNAAPKPIEYSIDFDETQNHYLHITAKLPVSKRRTELTMATWTPGSYLVREYARHIDSLTMTDAAGQPVKFKKVKKNRWRVETSKLKTLTVKYRLYCNEMTVRTNWTGKTFAVINGAPTFITLAKQRQRSHRVTLNLPSNWRRSASALPNPDGAHQYIANSFDALVDNPIVAGNVSVYPFDVGGIPHQLVNVGEAGYWDGAKAAADLKKLVAAHHRMWQVVPYQKYLFINVIAEARGGLEHDDCTLIMTSRWNYRDPERYADWLSLASHEFFHTWNVRRLRPKSLIRYDYQREMYTRSLWIAEGITSYYEDLALVRAGLIDRDDFVKRLSKNLESVQTKEGRKIQTLSDASFDTWIKFYRPDENSPHTRISYYSKGAVAAFLLDVKIRELTRGEKSLDDVMRKMYSEFLDDGYSPSDFRRTASEVAGVELDAWFAQAIDSTEELDYGKLNFVGMQLKGAKSDQEPTDDRSSDSEAGEEASAARKDDADPWVGIGGAASGDSVIVRSVTPDSPGYQAGVQTGDEVIAIDGFRLKGKLDQRLKQFPVDQELTFLISRRGQLMRLPVTPRLRDKKNWKLWWIPEPSEQQRQQRDRWLMSPDGN